MGEVIARLEQLGATQVSSTSSSRQTTTSKSVSRNSLRATLDAMSLAAGAMAESTPGLEDKFLRPRHRGEAALLSAARAFLRDAPPFSAEFIKFGMAADFLTELEQQITEVVEATSERHGHTQSRVAATAELDEAIEDGLKLRRQLNAIVRNSSRNDVGVLAAWESASHIERQSRSAETSTPDTPEPTSPPETP